MKNNHLEEAIKTVDIEIAALVFGKERLNENFANIIELIISLVPPGRVIVTGVGKSGHIAKKIAATLASTGTPSVFVHPAEAGHGDLGMITKEDIVIAISQSGNSEELVRILPYIKRNGIKLVGLTGGDNSLLAINSDFVIDTSVPKEACPLGLAPTASTTLALALGDAVAMCLLKARGFSEEDFALTHPHGALGRRLLLRVSEVMTKPENTPIVHDELSVKDALVTMSAMGLGFLIVNDKTGTTVGVFTDGDLRRCMDRDIDIHDTNIADVMTTSFKSINQNELAVTAVEIMDNFKVSALPVLNESGDVIGALNMRLLLNAGVV